MDVLEARTPVAGGSRSTPLDDLGMLDDGGLGDETTRMPRRALGAQARARANTPNVAHDNPTEQPFHASLILGLTDALALRAFYGEQLAALSGNLPEFVTAAHAYEVTEALTYVKDGTALPHYQA